VRSACPSDIAARKEQALWDLVWDGLQIVAGAVITVVGLGLTPFTGGVSLGLTVLGGSMVVGGVNSASDAVGKWYDVNVAQPAVDSGSWGLQALAGVGSGVGSMASEAAQLNVKEMGEGVWSLATDASVRGQLWDQLKTTTGKVLAGDAYVIGEVVGSVVVPGAGAVKFSKPTDLLKKLSGEPDFGKPIKYTDPKKATNLVDRVTTAVPEEVLKVLPANLDPRYGRPSHWRKGNREEVWEAARGDVDNHVRDPETREVMDPDKPWVMGHAPGHEFQHHQRSAQGRGLTRKEFLEEHFTLKDENGNYRYRPETPSTSSGHRHELPWEDYIGK